MLVLSRKRGEQIVIPSCALTVTVLAVKGNNVRLGISAPPELEVYREEILRQGGVSQKRTHTKVK